VSHDLADSPAPQAASPFSIIAWVTLGTALLLWGAAAVQPGGSGRTINLVTGLTLGVISVGLWHLHRRLTHGTPAVVVRAD
jgi:hypothetical protein